MRYASSMDSRGRLSSLDSRGHGPTGRRQMIDSAIGMSRDQVGYFSLLSDYAVSNGSGGGMKARDIAVPAVLALLVVGGVARSAPVPTAGAATSSPSRATIVTVAQRQVH